MTALKSATGRSESSGKKQIEEGCVRRRLFVLAAIALSLSACELRAEIAINDDGSGTVGMVFAVEPEMLEFYGQTGLGADPFAELRADLADDPVSWEVDEFSEGGLKGIRAVFPFASVDDLLDKMTALDGSGGGEGAIKDFTIERQSGGWAFSGRSADAQEELSNGQIPIPVDQLASILNIQFRVTLPGQAASHNADEVTSSGDRTTFVWKPSVTSKTVELRAATAPGGASSPVLPAVLGLAALGVVSFIWSRRSQKEGPPAFDLSSAIPDEVVTDTARLPAGGHEGAGAKEDAPLSG